MKKWIKGKGFGFITSDDGGEDEKIHCTQLFDIKALQQGDTVAYDTEYDKTQGKVQGRQLHVTG